MGRCQCLKRDHKQCTRKGSKKSDQLPTFCWQHQKCKQMVDEEFIEYEVEPMPLPMPITPSYVSLQSQQSPQTVKISQLPSPKKAVIVTQSKPKSQLISLNKPFIQNGDKIAVFDPNLGMDTLKGEQAVILEKVVGGLWDVDASVVKDDKDNFSHLNQIEARATGINTSKCEWEYEGVVTSTGWVGIFDQSVITKQDLRKIIAEKDIINRHNFGIYANSGLAGGLAGGSVGEFEVDVCYDVKGNIVAIRVVFVKIKKQKK